MNAVRENPYRTLGLFGNSTEKELQKQIATIKRFAEVGKTKSFDYDFSFLGDIVREEQMVSSAACRIEQAKNKVHYSLFWFINTNHIDEAALNHLKEANIEKAIEIWEKLIKDNSITVKNYSAAINLSTLQLGLTTHNGSFSTTQFQRSIELKGLIISSDAYMTFVQLVAGENTSVSKETLLKGFVDEVFQIVKPYLNKSTGITTAQLIEAFKVFPSESRQYLSGKFTEGPTINIERKIEKTKDNRTEDACDAEQYGEELYKSTKEDLVLLKNILGANSVNYQILANKVANEILQCSIDFFNYYNSEGETDFDPLDDALKIANYAKIIVSNGQIKNRIEEALNTLEEMRFKDAYQIIAFLNEIVATFEQVKKENSSIENLLSGRRVVVNEDKIMEMVKPLLDSNIIEKIAKSGKEELISIFYNSLENFSPKISAIYNFSLEACSPKISLKDSNFFFKKMLEFISYLPITNSIKFNFEKLKLENELHEFQKELSGTKTKKMYASELQVMQSEMSKIKEWQLFRSSETREQQIAEQKKKIDNLVSKGEAERKKEISRIEEQIVIKNRELQNLIKK